MDKISQTEKMRAALEAVQHYLLTVPEGAHKEILYQIDDALIAYRFRVPVDISKMHAVLYDAKCYLLKHAGVHIYNADDADAEKFASILRQINEALKELDPKQNWSDLINKTVIVEMSDGELGEAKVIRLSPNGKAVQLDFATKEHPVQILFWVSIDKCPIIDILKEEPICGTDQSFKKPWWKYPHRFFYPYPKSHYCGPPIP